MFDQTSYMKEYSKRPHVRQKISDYQKWFYKHTDVGKQTKIVASLTDQLKDAKTEGTRFNLLIRLAFAKLDYNQTKITCGGVRGRK